jgi:hypothetical protein
MMRRPERAQIPKRWIHCRCFGDLIPGTPFVPLKTPLGAKFDSSLYDLHKFAPQDFLNAQHHLGRSVVQLVSFANTRAL